MKLKNVNSLAYVNYHSDSLCQGLTNSTKVSSNLIMGYVGKQLNACPCLSPQEGLETSMRVQFSWDLHGLSR